MGTAASLRVVSTAVLLALVSAMLVATASASGSIRPAPGAPDPRLMVLTSPDLGGAKVTKQHYYKDTDFPSVISYSREFDGGRTGATRFLDVDSEAEIGTSAQSTSSFVRTIRRLFGSKAARVRIAKEFAKEAGGGGLVSVASIARPRNLGVGVGSFDLLITLRTLGVRTDLHVAIFTVERVLGGVIAVGEPGRRVPLTAMTRLAKVMAGRMSAELGPKNTAVPTVSGAPQVGQTLTATPGTWSGGAPTFSYQWQRCDATGGSCTDITGATGQSYGLSDADLGSTIRVVVTARNALGVASATSSPTAVVSAVGAPTNTSLPTISGTAQVGQTLSAGTGSWTGSPTSFSFQWQRCPSIGTSCVAIPGATAGTYLLLPADRGSTIRVAVAATNSVGTATAVSAPTSVVT